jgi:hypothetical protein
MDKPARRVCPVLHPLRRERIRRRSSQVARIRIEVRISRQHLSPPIHKQLIRPSPRRHRSHKDSMPISLPLQRQPSSPAQHHRLACIRPHAKWSLCYPQRLLKLIRSTTQNNLPSPTRQVKSSLDRSDRSPQAPRRVIVSSGTDIHRRRPETASEQRRNSTQKLPPIHQKTHLHIFIDEHTSLQVEMSAVLKHASLTSPNRIREPE